MLYPVCYLNDHSSLDSESSHRVRGSRSHRSSTGFLQSGPGIIIKQSYTRVGKVESNEYLQSRCFWCGNKGAVNKSQHIVQELFFYFGKLIGEFVESTLDKSWHVVKRRAYMNAHVERCIFLVFGRKFLEKAIAGSRARDLYAKISKCGW